LDPVLIPTVVDVPAVSGVPTVGNIPAVEGVPDAPVLACALAVLLLLMFLTVVDVSGILGVAIITAIAAVHTAVDVLPGVSVCKRFWRPCCCQCIDILLLTFHFHRLLLGVP
jgi:hypothetical protein